jgi:nitric oxide reductase activation protein
MVATVDQHGASDSGGFDKSIEAAQGKRLTGGQKRARASGRARELGRFSENLPRAGDVKNDTAGL